MTDPSNSSIILGEPQILSGEKVFGISALKRDGISGSLCPLGQAHVIEKTICCGTPLRILPEITRLGAAAQSGTEGVGNPEARPVNIIIIGRRFKVTQ